MTDSKTPLLLDANGEIVQPNVGDAELVRLEFESGGVILFLNLADGSHLNLRIVGLRWLSFSTNYPQNVIDRIVMTKAVDSALRKAPEEVRQQYQSLLGSSRNRATASSQWTAIHIYPSAGPELTCIAQEVAVL